MTQLTNNSGISLLMAIWLAHDDYTSGANRFPGKRVISATALLKSPRQAILTRRLPPQNQITDIADLIPSRLGQAVHSSIEDVWRNRYGTSMRKLGYPEKLINRVKINPETVLPDDIPIYLEQRAFRELNGVVISGQYDQVINGELNDIKTTSVYGYLNQTKENDYQLQGSIYRWLSPDKILSDTLRIQFVFTDWQRAQSKSNPNYPNHRVAELTIPLLTLEETEAWISNRIALFQKYEKTPEPELPFCTDKELWKTDDVFKYYADPTKAAEGGRSTKNFPNYLAAAAYRAKQGKGVVLTVPGKVRACSYCPAFDICTQKDRYTKDHERS